MGNEELKIGYKIKHVGTGKRKHRAGGTLWSTTGDIYYSFSKAKAVLKSHLKHGAGRNVPDPDSYIIEEYTIEPTGKIFKGKDI